MQTRTYKITAAQLPAVADPYKQLLDDAYVADATLAGFELKAVFWDKPEYDLNDIPTLMLIFQKA